MVVQSTESMSENKIRKIYTVAEIEATTTSIDKKNILSKVANLKQVDPAVMQFSTKQTVTRYEKKELEVLKDSKLSQAPPPCLYEPRVIRMNILKYQKNHPEDYESQMKAFRELLPNLSMSSWDPKVLELLNNYHRSLLYPHNYGHNDYNSPRTINQNFNRKVSWGDQKQFLDNQHTKVPAYDQKNFFDNITTTTTMRPPRMGVGSLGYQKNQQQVRSAKGNSCSNERYSQNSQNLSSGSVGTNETKSSYDESIDKSLTDKADSIDMNLKVGDRENTEPEPEWFSWPASRHDVIDLHGFDEEEGTTADASERPSSSSSEKMGFDEFVRYNQRQNEVASSAYRRSSYNQPTRYPRTYNNPSASNYNYNSNNNPTRYRNPLHQSNSSSSSFNSSFNRTGSDDLNYSGHNIEVAINPFFDAWNRKTNWMGNGKQMMTIADVENALKQKQFQQQQAYGLPYGGNPAVPQFFQNAAAANQQNRIRQVPSARGPIVFDNIQQRPMPTPEQLQQHTSEIMRNAMMRKQFQDGKFP